jgi:hypothetical protein
LPGWPGGHLLSLLRQRKKAKKGDRKPLPFGFPALRRKKWEVNETRFAQTTFTS